MYNRVLKVRPRRCDLDYQILVVMVIEAFIWLKIGFDIKYLSWGSGGVGVLFRVIFMSNTNG